MNIFGERAELASRMLLDCLQSAFSLKIRLVLIAASAIANHDVMLLTMFSSCLSRDQIGRHPRMPLFAQSSCLPRFTWHSLLAENVFTFKHNYSRSS